MILSGASCPMGLASPLRVASRTCRVITDCAQELLATTEISVVNISKNRPILRTIVSPLNGLAIEDVPFVGRDGPGSPFVGVAYHWLARTARKISLIPDSVSSTLSRSV